MSGLPRPPPLAAPCGAHDRRTPPAKRSEGQPSRRPGLARPHEAQVVALRMHPLGDAISAVALDGLDAAVGQDALDDADVLVPDDEVAGLRGGGGGHPAAGALRPGGDVVDAAEALALVAERNTGLLAGPGGEVGAPRARAGGAGGGAAVHGDARGVVGPGRELGLADLALGGTDDRVAGARGARRADG